MLFIHSYKIFKTFIRPFLFYSITMDSSIIDNHLKTSALNKFYINIILGF